MKRLLKVLIVVVVIVLAKFCLVYGLNMWVVGDFERGVYHEGILSFLQLIGFPETYIAYYNEGNIKLKTEDYGAARREYERALDHRVPDKRVCDVRINLSLAIVGGINMADVDAALADLAKARQNLYQDGCAEPDSRDGRSVIAEDLEEEIIKLEESLKKQGGTSSTGDQDDENDANDDSEDEDRDVEEQLKDYSQEASAARQEDMADAENLDNGYTYYNGKKW